MRQKFRTLNWEITGSVFVTTERRSELLSTNGIYAHHANIAALAIWPKLTFLYSLSSSVFCFDQI